MVTQIEEFNLEDIYTTLSETKKEIQGRYRNQELKKIAQDLFGKIPEIFNDSPKAIIFRNIASPNLELHIAKEYACMAGLDLVVFEYTADKFCTRNRDKLHLGKMMFFSNKNKNVCVGKNNIVNIKDDDNKKFLDIKTVWGQDLIDFHHDLFKKCGFEDVKFFDASMYKENGLDAFEIYKRILSLCTHSAVLLENFLIKADRGEKKFTEEIIIPAFLEIQKSHKMKPLIVPLLGSDGEGSVCWQHYPESIKEHVEKNMKK